MAVCTFSGHRPEKLPWGTDESDPRCEALKIMLEREIRKLCERGVYTYICGMARGADLYFFEILTKLKTEYPLFIEAALPCRTQADRWDTTQKRKYLDALDQCDKITWVEENYSGGCMLRRNRYMVDHADILMTVFDGSSGGTAATIEYAKAKEREIISLWK